MKKLVVVQLYSVALLSIVVSGSSVTDSTNNSCPTWLYLTDGGWCTCGSSLSSTIICNNISQQVGIHTSYCLTSFSANNDEAVVGHCIFAENYGEYLDDVGLFIKVDKNISQQNNQLCGYLNREGRLCGDCEKDHFVSPYSYDLKCYQCKRGLISNIILYLTVAFVPLTLFLCLVMFFHISVASPQLNAIIFLCQIYTIPAALIILIQNTRNTHNLYFIQFVSTVYGVWNLDFFRTIIPPICLPLTTLQVIALDYLVAVYPLLLLMCFYLLVTSHNRGCGPVVKLWRPFLMYVLRIRRQWDIKQSIIHAFVTFILLSYVKFTSVSTDLLVPTGTYDIRGSQIGYYMYYDAGVKLLSNEHMPLFILAVSVSLITLLFPLLLLLYPMKWFQVFLNKCHMNSPGLRMFMDCFQGYYHDRTDGGCECRYFSALYPLLRICGTTLFALTRSDLFFSIMTLFLIIATSAIALINPYKTQYKVYNKIDQLLLASAAALCISLSCATAMGDLSEIKSWIGYFLAGILSFVPLVGLIIVVSIHVLKKQFIFHLKNNTLKLLKDLKLKYVGNRIEYEEINSFDYSEIPST